jgi:hypothetical protein
MSLAADLIVLGAEVVIVILLGIYGWLRLQPPWFILFRMAAVIYFSVQAYLVFLTRDLPVWMRIAYAVNAFVLIAQFELIRRRKRRLKLEDR